MGRRSITGGATARGQRRIQANWSKKSYNNAISVLRRAFKFGVPYSY